MWLAIAASLAVVGAVVVGPRLYIQWAFARDVSLGLGLVSEERCIAVFAAQRATCEALRRMALADSSPRRFGTSTLPSRPAEYRPLLDRLGAYDVIAQRPEAGHGYDCEIRIGYHGNFFRATTRSFVYSPTGVAPQVWNQPEDEQWFKPLSGGWFLQHVVQ